MMANIVAMFHSALHMDDGYVNHIAIVQDVDGYHNHFLYDEDKGKGAAGTGPFRKSPRQGTGITAHSVQSCREDTRSQKITKSWRLRTSTIKSLLRK